MANRRRFESLRVVDVSDREVLWWLHDAADPDGWASSKEIVVSTGKGMWAEPDHAHKIVSGRLSWLMRYGAVQREHLEKDGRPMFTKAGKPKYGQRWRLLPTGEQWMRGRLPKPVERALEGADIGTLGVALRVLHEQYGTNNDTVKALLRREWTFGTRR